MVKVISFLDVQTMGLNGLKAPYLQFLPTQIYFTVDEVEWLINLLLIALPKLNNFCDLGVFE